MKKLLIIAGLAFTVLAGCRQAPKVTYEDVKAEYEAAMTAKKYDAAKFPHVTASTFELLQSAAKTGQTFLADEEDLDGDGTNELLLGYELETSVGKSGFYISVFSQKNGQAVDVFAENFPTDKVYFMAIYKENLIRIDWSKDTSMTNNYYEIKDGQAVEIERLTQAPDKSGTPQFTDINGKNYGQIAFMGRFQQMIKGKTLLPELEEKTEEKATR